MKVICGLGNPGDEHAEDRHNAGFRVVDLLAERHRAPLNQQKFDALLAQAHAGPQRVLLLEPQTYMNLSGRSVSAALRFYKVEPADLLVVHDELDLPFGRLQLKNGGGAGGHNGLSSIAELLGSTGFARLRVGIGKPAGESPRDRVVGHVLGGFSKEERQGLPVLYARAADAAWDWAVEGLQTAMNRHNRKGT